MKGSFVCIAIVVEKKCWVNLGDTRAVLCVNGSAERISTDHKGTDAYEIKRI